MPCCLTIIAAIAPRLLMIFILLLTNWFRIAFDSWIWPLLGFFFMPYTTLAYMGAHVYGTGLHGFWLFVFIVAVLADAAAHGKGAKETRERQLGER
jgi:hypothetical protein